MERSTCRVYVYISISLERKFLIEIRHVNCVSRSSFDVRTVKVVWSFIYGTRIRCIILLWEFTRYCVCGRDQTESLCVAQPWFDYRNISSDGRDLSSCPHCGHCHVSTLSCVHIVHIVSTCVHMCPHCVHCVHMCKHCHVSTLWPSWMAAINITMARILIILSFINSSKGNLKHGCCPRSHLARSEQHHHFNRLSK